MKCNRRISVPPIVTCPLFYLIILLRAPIATRLWALELPFNKQTQEQSQSQSISHHSLARMEQASGKIINLESLAADGSNWVTYRDRMIYALRTRGWADHL